MWAAHATLLAEALTENVMDHSPELHIEQNSRDLHQLSLDNFMDIKRRNEAMLFTNLPSHVSARLRTVVSDVQVSRSVKQRGKPSSRIQVTQFHFEQNGHGFCNILCHRTTR
jgi:mediator of RNA polymerase II transcription subunit 12